MATISKRPRIKEPAAEKRKVLSTPPPEPTNGERGVCVPRMIEPMRVPIDELSGIKAWVSVGRLDDGRWAFGASTTETELGATNLVEPWNAGRAPDWCESREEALLAAAELLEEHADDNCWPPDAKADVAQFKARWEKQPPLAEEFQAAIGKPKKGPTPDAQSPSPPAPDIPPVGHHGRRKPSLWTEERNPRYRLVIDPEFRDACRPLSDEERRLLRDNIAERGCLQPLVAWWDGKQLLLVDGHNRFEIATELDTWVDVITVEFASREAALQWIAEHQAGRRNLTPEQISALRLKVYREEKAATKNGAHTEPRGKAAERASQRLAGTAAAASPATIKREARLAKQREQIARASALSLLQVAELRPAEVAELAELPDKQIGAALAGGVQSWREEKQFEPKTEKLVVPLKKEHRCKASILLLERPNGRWIGAARYTNAQGGGVLGDDLEGTIGHKLHRSREAALNAAIDELERTAESQGNKFWPAAARKAIRDWRLSLSGQPEKKVKYRTGKEIDRRRDAQRHIEQYLHRLAAGDAWDASGYLLDALNQWRSRNKTPQSGKRKPR